MLVHVCVGGVAAFVIGLAARSVPQDAGQAGRPPAQHGTPHRGHHADPHARHPGPHLLPGQDRRGQYTPGSTTLPEVSSAAGPAPSADSSDESLPGPAETEPMPSHRTRQLDKLRGTQGHRPVPPQPSASPSSSQQPQDHRSPRHPEGPTQCPSAFECPAGIRRRTAVPHLRGSPNQLLKAMSRRWACRWSSSSSGATQHT